MKVTKKELDSKYINVLTTEKVNQIIDKTNRGEKLSKNEKIWFDNKVGIRKEGVKFAATKQELDEWVKCKMDIHYFADTYCQIKREDGTFGPMKLRDYQKEMLDLYQNKYSILCASRQTGKCLIINTLTKIKDTKTDEVSILSMGELYYNLIKNERKLTLVEHLKLCLYKILSFIK